MTTGEMQTLTNRFQSIMADPEEVRNHRLAFLMDDMEMAYQIPMLAKSPRMKTVNPFALQLYRTVSEAREFT